MEKITMLISGTISIILVVIVLMFNVNIGIDSKSEDVLEFVDFTIELSEAYAGPCGRRGCSGKSGDCGVSHTVLEVGSLQIERHCKGSKG